jgi:hypothetical protein
MLQLHRRKAEGAFDRQNTFRALPWRHLRLRSLITATDQATIDLAGFDGVIITEI